MKMNKKGIHESLHYNKKDVSVIFATPKNVHGNLISGGGELKYSSSLYKVKYSVAPAELIP
ncbi:hypothetical protein J6590_036651 [Homalodisca vitripennis]|nr:hypothetical protein J6590_036651 [Homalodisca vitripennis]